VGLVITSICVYPGELKQDTTVPHSMFHALHLLAEAIEVTLDFRLPSHFSPAPPVASE
jgi:hypothetical protein